MFEKSLYDLIRGLRNHKGNEKEYIQNSIRECRKEIKGSDMDLKATAVLKLSYLEMFGYDMSWAAFNVLEVMSSPKHQQKKVGYLAAVQSYRPDTEILMLAENLLKKDLNSPQIPTLSLPLVAIPHVISPSMANSLLFDLLPRLSHSHPSVRKKTIVTLYRLALVYPETLRPAWPKIKERLLDDKEDPSVTAAVVNVICELGWRRPRDFLPLAPRLFDLLVDGTNNWMAIKVIKLFSTLTPLEPRLVKKLLPPLTTIIKTTPAMSLLYECINGIIQGGILQAIQGTTDGDEIARLCVGKLRGMLVIEGDPNLKYVALLAFTKIVELHPYLVQAQEDVIMECLDDADISIRSKALELVVGMANASNLMSIVDRLMAQLQNAPIASGIDDPLNDRGMSNGVQPATDSDDEDATQSIKRHEQRSSKAPPLPEDYRQTVIERILELCSHSMYSNISDFDWYIELLVALLKQVPAPSASLAHADVNHGFASDHIPGEIAYGIGCELRNIAVRVKGVRSECVQAAERLISVDGREQLFPRSHSGGQAVLEPTVWIVGEYPDLLANPGGALESLTHASVRQLPSTTLSAYLQAGVKLLITLIGDSGQTWTSERKTMVTLVIAKVSNFLESFTTHPNLEVQERSIEYLELIRLASEAATSHAAQSDYGDYTEPPLLLTQALPALFTGSELNPVAKDAQQRVPLPDGLDLDVPINDRLDQLLNVADFDTIEDDEFDSYYYEKPTFRPTSSANEPAVNRLQAAEEVSYQQGGGNSVTSELVAKKKAARKDRYKDDPFYIPSENNSGTSTPLHNIIQGSDGDTLDVDSIPIMELNLGNDDLAELKPAKDAKIDTAKRKPKRKVEILADETIGNDAVIPGIATPPDLTKMSFSPRGRKTLLQVDSAGLRSLSLEGANTPVGSRPDIQRQRSAEIADLEMAKAMKEVERLRLQMQRDAETIEAPSEGVVVKRKKKRRTPAIIISPEAGNGAERIDEVGERSKKKKKKKQPKNENETESAADSQLQRNNLASKAVDATNEASNDPGITIEDSNANAVEGTSLAAESANASKKKKKRRTTTIADEVLPSASAS